MRISEFEWRQCDRFNDRISTIHCRGRVWSKKEHQDRVICSSGVNTGWFYASCLPDALNEILLETADIIHADLMERNVIPRQWPKALLDEESKLNEHPFIFRVEKTVLVDTNWGLSEEESSYVEMHVWSNHHCKPGGALKSKIPV